MDLTKLSETELKALAYDELLKSEMAQSNLRTINEELGRRQNAVQESISEEMDAREQATDGKKVGKGNSQEKVTKES